MNLVVYVNMNKTNLLVLSVAPSCNYFTLVHAITISGVHDT